MWFRLSFALARYHVSFGTLSIHQVWSVTEVQLLTKQRLYDSVVSSAVLLDNSAPLNYGDMLQGMLSWQSHPATSHFSH